ncbi:RNA-directed DNA polymerase from mobile element jockey-like [Rhizophagus clarus]|uniref:RNA-directed DNA polymerase from mobile element jockey-like n=1 Tax=Rhizophagus clarus TaxID=94130 RepID=A0A8H3LPM3_9GLOM|nr:RNA-directed DNA polymerase from mobile element jockey-like [Rhizophagus clarus]
MINNNIHILHICETHETQAPHQESSKAHKSFTIQKITELQHTNTKIHNQLHFHIINNPIDDGSRKAGNAIIISDLFFKHIARIHTIPGRYIYINLNFKHKHQINIFGFYLPTNSTTNRQNIYEAITEVYKQHFNKKINTRTYNFVLGDFNDNDVIFDDHDTPIRQDGRSVIGYRKKFFELLKNQQYADVQKKLLTRPPNTYKNHHGAFRIDYIYANSLILNKINSTDVITDYCYTSDYDLVVAHILTNDLFTIEKTQNISPSITNTQTYRRSLNDQYQIKDNETWSKFHNKINNTLNEQYYKALFINTDNTHKINAQAEALHQVLIKTAKCTFTIKKFKLTQTPEEPLIIRQLSNAKKKIGTLIHHFKFFIKLYILPMQNCDIPENLHNFYNKDTFWTKKVLQKLTTLSQKFNFNYIWPESLNGDNHEEIKVQFELLHTEIHKAYEKHLNKHRLHNINKYIERRQQDFSDNQTRMLNSILERKPQKITIDRLLITPEEENPQLITNQEDIERITIDHYQNVASSNNPALFTSFENLTPFWQQIYKEKYKSPEHQSILTTIITLDELTTTIQSLPNNKAPGPTGITYEFWKHFPKPHYKLLLTFFNNILNTGFIPSAWKEALLYPIPKPEFWNYQLDKTRPIILLETLRKIFVKIITDRLNKFLSSTKALQPNNQAGIAGSSTAEIILTIQTCIDIQITNNQKFYIMVQDLSKAYDRINLDLLILAMKRLNIPQIFQSTIINLFKGHKNSVIIGNHLTNSFDLRNGVIQGEVISPILWVLYYDPLFEAINQTTYGRINLQANHPMNIYDHQNDTSIHSLQKNCKLLGYLDDTTWLNSSISHLEEHLNIADEFYNFSNIKINKAKCHLLTNDQDCINKGSVEINFGPTRINVDIIGKTDNLRILGAYFNAFNNHNKLYKNY